MTIKNIINDKNTMIVVEYCPVCKDNKVMEREEKTLEPGGVYPNIMFVYKCNRCGTTY